METHIEAVKEICQSRMKHGPSETSHLLAKETVRRNQDTKLEMAWLKHLKIQILVVETSEF